MSAAFSPSTRWGCSRPGPAGRGYETVLTEGHLSGLISFQPALTDRDDSQHQELIAALFELGREVTSVLDLNELLREQFYLALPMKPLCTEDCQGICPQCGTNRNTAPCDCHPQWEDPRMAGLKTLLSPTMQSPHRGGPKKRKHDDA